MKQRIKILQIADPDFNYGHSERFFRAFDKEFDIHTEHLGGINTPPH